MTEHPSAGCQGHGPRRRRPDVRELGAHRLGDGPKMCHREIGPGEEVPRLRAEDVSAELVDHFRRRFERREGADEVLGPLQLRQERRREDRGARGLLQAARL